MARFIKIKRQLLFFFYLALVHFNPFCAGGRQRRNMSRHVKAVLYNQTAPLPQTSAQVAGGGSFRGDHPNFN